MSAESELLIKIRTILESQGIDAAKQKLAELAQSTTAATAAEGAANAVHERSVQQNEKAAHAIHSLHRALSSGVGPFRAIMFATQELGGGLANLAGKIAAVGAAAMIGWEIGTKFREWVTGAKAAEEELKLLQKASDELKDRVNKLTEIRLENLKREAEEVAKGFATAVDRAERLKRLSDLREDAQLAAQLAENDLRYQRGDISKGERDETEIRYTEESHERKNVTEKRRIAEEEKTVDAMEGQANSKFTFLTNNLTRSSQAEKANLADAVRVARELGISDPEQFLSRGMTDDLKKKIEELRSFEGKHDFENNYGVTTTRISPKTAEERKRDFSRADILDDVVHLREISDAARRDLETYKRSHGGYDETMESVSKRREQLAADKDVLIEKERATSALAESQRQSKQNELRKDFDVAVDESADPATKARKLGRTLLDSLKLNFATRTDNSGLPLSAAGQSAFDAGRMHDSEAIARAVMGQAYKGGNAAQLTEALIKALSTRASSEVTLSKDQIMQIMSAIRDLGQKSQAIQLDVANLKQQTAVTRGTN